MTRTTRALAPAALLAAILAAPGGLAQEARERDGGRTLRAPDPGARVIARPSSHAPDRFELVPGSGTGPLQVTFEQCNTAATNTCKHGVSDISHDEPSGSCSFSCFAAPS